MKKLFLFIIGLLLLASFPIPKARAAQTFYLHQATTTVNAVSYRTATTSAPAGSLFEHSYDVSTTGEKTATPTPVVFISNAVSASTDVGGTYTFNIYAKKTANNPTAYLRSYIYKIDSAGAATQIGTYAQDDADAMQSASYSLLTWTHAISSTTLLAGERLGIEIRLNVTTSKNTTGKVGLDTNTENSRVDVPWNFAAAAPTVSSISPNNGLNTQTVSNITISGANFQSGATAKLTKTGEIDITPSTPFTFTNSTTLSNGAFDLNGKAVGFWNVVVTNPDAQSGTLVNGFEIKSSSPSAPANLYQFKNNTDTAQPPTTNIAVGGGINQTNVWFRMDMSSAVTGLHYPQVEVKPINTPFDGTGTTEGTGVNLAVAGGSVQGFVQITGLSNGTSYHWRARVRNANGTGPWSAFGGNLDQASSPPNSDTDFYIDISFPIISNVSSTSITDTTATITWNTDENSTSQVEYGTTISYGSLQPASPSDSVTSHSVNLSSLTPSTLYHFRVRSKDGAGNESISGDYTFTTAAAPVRVLKTIEYFIGQDGTIRTSGTSVAFPFSVYISESSPQIKSAFVEITGVSTGNNNESIDVDINGANPVTGLTLNSTNETEHFQVLYNANNSLSNIIAAGTYNYTLNVRGTGSSVSLWGAKMVITYTYVQ